MVARAAIITSVAALVGVVSAQLKVVSPGGPDLWWVAQSANNIVWNCKESQVSNFTIAIANSNPTVLVAPQAIIAIQNNFDCSKTITTQQSIFAANTGYTIIFSDPFNSTNVYATSQPFEIKALGAAYPSPSATPTDASASNTGSATATGSGSSPSKSSGAVGSHGVGVGAVAAVLAGAAALAL